MGDLFPDAPPQVSLARQLEAVEREIKQRARVYPRLVADKKMTQAFADEETAAMRAVLATLRALEARSPGAPIAREAIDRLEAIASRILASDRAVFDAVLRLLKASTHA